MENFNLYQIRKKHYEWEDDLFSLSDSGNVKESLKIILNLIGKTSIERYEVDEYDSKTGKPATFTWKDFSEYSNRFLVYHNCSLNNDIDVSLYFLNKIQNSPIVFNYQNKKYVAFYEKGSKDHYGYFKDYLSITEIQEID